MEILRKYSPLRLFQAYSSTMSGNSVYDFKEKDIDGNEVSLDKYKGKVLLIANVASKCGFTKSNYTQFQELHDKFADKGFNILAFPCNQFGNQESGTECEIKKFSENYNTKFDMFSKIDVNGPNTDPLFQYLKKEQGGTLIDAIKWNFTKFLIDRNGVPVARYAPTVEPHTIAKDIEKLL